ncbi:hydroxyproline-rich glycoprotein DZ-HRGP [Ophiocordyceps camponoti-floridani]|uniref:Hydroxyproline-rich glycoprotein DZ-HRGP n=1 Tax=Ophiocordyceps camponoti-floridani TaxID=2030778 RepID=A0A8H4VCW6_9HYPO|nr:hydroxyproline-rich glycoprotein DZ-HRGP [Ophiocordyceps camponoti-floridani]
MPTKKQVEDVVRDTNLGDMKQDWIDNIVDIVHRKFSSGNDSSDSSEPSSEASTPSDGPYTPDSDFGDVPDWLPKVAKPFQATVEEDDDGFSSTKESCLDSPDDAAKPCSNTSRRRPPPQQPAVSKRPALRPSTPYREPLGGPPSVTSTAPDSPKLRPTVHFSERPPPKLNHRGQARPESAAKTAAASELSVVDLQWGRLFTGNGEPTTRLRQVLRGLAGYVISEFEPKNSLVLAPSKLRMFYKRFKLDVEHYPLQVIFDCDSRKFMNSLEHLYLDLRCDYHLVQGESREKAYIPALTSDGFVNWMSVFIQVSPDSEARRLDSIMAALPIEATSETPDGKPERLPKQLSRHLFPSRAHDKTKHRVAAALTDWVEAMGYSASRPPSWMSTFRDMVSRSLSPKAPEPVRREDKRERETYIEVIELPASTTTNSTPTEPSRRPRDHREEPSSRPSKVLVEETASRSGRDSSPRRHHRHHHQHHHHRHHRHREASPRPSKHRHSEHAGTRRKTTPPSSRDGSPKSGLGRADNYTFFQAREMGPTYDDVLREGVAGRGVRTPRYAG